MKGKKICDRCKKKIGLDEKGVMLMTFLGNENLEKVYWHFDCYIEWRDKSIELRARSLINQSVKVALPNVVNLMKVYGAESRVY